MMSYRQKKLFVLWCCLWFCSSFMAAWAQKEKILIVRPENRHFFTAESRIREDLGDRFTLISVRVEKHTSYEHLEKALEKHQPKLIVLMDQPAIRHYRAWVKSQPPDFKPVPVVTLMAVYLEREVEDLPNATGIKYEIPGVVILTNLRSLIGQKVEKVGVLYRTNLSYFFEAQKQKLEIEQIELVGREITTTSSRRMPRDIKRALSQLIQKEKVDAIWVLNDSVLVNSTLVTHAWLPALRRFDKPVVVGVRQLVQEGVNLGSFAVVPDHAELGGQTASLIERIVENDWRADNIPVADPISVLKIFNRGNLTDAIDIDPTYLQELDELIQ